MAIRKSRNVSLTPELEQFVAGRVATGRYQNASEVFRAALRLLEAKERKEEQKRGAPSQSEPNTPQLTSRAALQP